MIENSRNNERPKDFCDDSTKIIQNFLFNEDLPWANPKLLSIFQDTFKSEGIEWIARLSSKYFMKLFNYKVTWEYNSSTDSYALSLVIDKCFTDEDISHNFMCLKSPTFIYNILTKWDDFDDLIDSIWDKQLTRFIDKLWYEPLKNMLITSFSSSADNDLKNS